MAHHLWGVPVTTKVDAFQTEVGCDQSFVAARNLKNGAVIPNPGSDSTPK